CLRSCLFSTTCGRNRIRKRRLSRRTSSSDAAVTREVGEISILSILGPPPSTICESDYRDSILVSVLHRGSSEVLARRRILHDAECGCGLHHDVHRSLPPGNRPRHHQEALLEHALVPGV